MGVDKMTTEELRVLEEFVLMNPEYYQPIYDDDWNLVGYDYIIPEKMGGV